MTQATGAQRRNTPTYKAGRHFLQIPGPTNVPDRILRAIDNGTIDRLVKTGYFEKVFGPQVKAEAERKGKLAYR